MMIHASTDCDALCRWEVRVMAWGVNRNLCRYPRHLGPQLARELPLTPLGFYRDEAGIVTHRPGGLIQDDAGAERYRYVAGIFEEGWADDGALYGVVHLAPEARPLRRALALMARDRRLDLAGVSIHGSMPAFGVGVERNIARAVDVAYSLRIASVDVVFHPACEGAHFLRPLPNNAPASALTRSHA